MFTRPRRAFARLVAGLLAATGLAFIPPATAHGDPPTTHDASTMLGPVTFSDDFDGPAGTRPDPAKWRYDIGGGGWGNNELQYYTDRADNASLDGTGNLVITARRNNPSDFGCWYGTCEYTSARLLTSQTFTQAYGRFEARMKLPRGQGIWPAFWMLGNDIGDVGWPQSGEIDIMENIGREPSTVHGTLHGPGYSGGNASGGSYTLPDGRQFADGFHTFTVDWSPNLIRWYVDGIQYSQKTPADVTGEWVFDHPFFMIMNVAVGGNWPGSPDGSTQFPQTLVVDYVRVNAHDGGGGGETGRFAGLHGLCLDVAGAGTADGTTVQVAHCSSNPAQQWTAPGDGTLRALGKCLDVSGGSTADGARVQLWTCNGTGAQQWVHTGAGDLVNPQADKCLDVTGWGGDGTPVQLWTCNGGANQKWHRA
ncbi:beta-glucanase (GH16 family) [Stackebrandtia albiflava]|uniref:Beta-glucanase (GH16 family) n=1 Tax=Stackebrandtia albiflava TaxID=406432 RepID=A0A562V9L5_9ACTN|nr:glycoside hydrolase family 16 protein [Stackebrandtia albiflava]TWJ14576.1 beta-glucanase (GH16 family) [Stackebrandtia albiflava]